MSVILFNMCTILFVRIALFLNLIIQNFVNVSPVISRYRVLRDRNIQFISSYSRQGNRVT